MLEPPDLPNDAVSNSLYDAYGLSIAHIAFLPLGADANTAVYRAVADDGTPYFVKLRRGAFDPTAVLLPKWLSEQGIMQIIPPRPTTAGQLWAAVDPFTLILYPFVAGQDGFGVAMSARHWREFGGALKRLHTATVPSSILAAIQQETYDPRWREQVKRFVSFLDPVVDDPVAHQVAMLLQQQRDCILDLVQQAEQRAYNLQAAPPPFVVCHSDAHAGNVLIDANDQLYIVDWDAPIRAPKERDLMFVGGAQGFRDHSPHEEELLFYAGYGPTQINKQALAYYRFERIIQDIAVYCEQLLLTTEGGADRALSLHYLAGNFRPGSTIERAYAVDYNG